MMRTRGAGSSLRWRLMLSWGAGQTVLEPAGLRGRRGWKEGGRRRAAGEPALLSLAAPPLPLPGLCLPGTERVGADKQLIHTRAGQAGTSLKLFLGPRRWGPCQGPGGPGCVSTVRHRPEKPWSLSAATSATWWPPHRCPSFGKSMGTIYQSATHGAHVTLIIFTVTCRQGKPHTSVPQVGNEARRGESELAQVPSVPLASRSQRHRWDSSLGPYWLVRLPLPFLPLFLFLSSASLLCSLSLFLFHKHLLGISCVSGSVRGTETKW